MSEEKRGSSFGLPPKYTEEEVTEFMNDPKFCDFIAKRSGEIIKRMEDKYGSLVVQYAKAMMFTLVKSRALVEDHPDISHDFVILGEMLANILSIVDEDTKEEKNKVQTMVLDTINVMALDACSLVDEYKASHETESLIMRIGRGPNETLH